MSLNVENLKISVGNLQLVKGVSLKVNEGERVSIVGESGSGKSITCQSILRLLPENFTVSGKINVDGFDVLSAKRSELNRFRWKKVSIIFQDPSSSLNPLIPVGKQIEEAILFHDRTGKKEARNKVIELLNLAQVPDPEVRFNAYPHQLSGGIKQRVTIAMALACKPSYVIADEPTTALDVTVQAQILELINSLTIKEKIGFLLVTHDMGVAAEISDRIYVMYFGYIVEEGKTKEVFKNPLHPYTESLIMCTPTIDAGKKRRLFAIPGKIPEPTEMIKGCPFHPRCKKAMLICKEELPPIKSIDGRKVRCFLY